MPNLSREMRQLGNFNGVGAKETVIQQESDGTILAGKRKEPPVYPPSPTRVSTPNSKSVQITPTKQRKKLPRVSRERGTQPGNRDDVILFTESLGPCGEIIVLTATKRDKSSVFLKPILDSIANPRSASANALVDPDKFDCRLFDPKSLYLRKSRQDNTMIPIAHKSNLYHIGIVAYAQKDNYQRELSTDQFYLEKMFRNECEKILKEHDTKHSKRNKPAQYVSWKPSHSLSKPWGHPRPLDHVLLDSAVGNVLGIYFVDKEDSNEKDVFGTLKQYEMEDSFFSRHPETNKYSDLAVNTYGYPKL